MSFASTASRSRTAARPLAAMAAAGAIVLGCGIGNEPEATERPGTTTAAADPSTPPPPSTNLAPTDDPGDEPSGSDPAGSESAGRAPAPVHLSGRLAPRVLASHPHDPTSFTQGLEWYGAQLLESTGLKGESSLRLVDVDSGTATQRLRVDDDLFAEGVTVVGGRAIQLTWQAETLLETDLAAMGEGAEATTRRSGAYDGEGWGLCYDGARLVMSNGSATLAFRDPTTFAVTGTVEVTRDGAPVPELNELECVGDQVWANIWLSNEIVAIDPRTGRVDATLDASSLVPDGYENAANDVLNGIAYNPATGTFWLTGKRWPVLYEVELVPTDGS